MKKLALTNYYNFTKKENNDHICPHCSRKIQKWALSQCSSCNRFFCRSHMEPSIGNNKKCPGCRKHQQEFVKSEPVFGAMKAAESKIQQFRLAESQELEYALFASIFGNKDLIRYAQEDASEQQNNNQAAELDPKIDQNQPIEPQTIEPETTIQPDNFVESAADALASKIAESLKEAGITSDTDEAAAQMLNLILSESIYDNIKIAQANPTGANESFKGNPAVGMTESIARQPQYHPADLAPYGQLTPQEAQALDSIYNRYVATYGRAFFERLPETSTQNVMENRKRMAIFSQYLADVTRITNDPQKIFMFYQKMGIRPDIPMGIYR